MSTTPGTHVKKSGLAAKVLQTSEAPSNAELYQKRIWTHCCTDRKWQSATADSEHAALSAFGPQEHVAARSPC